MYYLFKFQCEGKDFSIVREFIHETEEEARRCVIEILNNMFKYYPRKLTLISKEKKEYNVWENLK